MGASRNFSSLEECGVGGDPASPAVCAGQPAAPPGPKRQQGVQGVPVRHEKKAGGRFIGRG